MAATIRELKALGYDGFLAYCARCKVSRIVPYSAIGDDELIALDVMAKFFCSACGSRPATVTSHTSGTERMRF